MTKFFEVAPYWAMLGWTRILSLLQQILEAR
jgi:hypothetical protein